MNTEEIVSSLWKALDAGYSLTDIQWPGLRFDTDVHDEWIAPGILAIPRPVARKNSLERFNIRFQVAIFTKGATNIYRLQEIDDAVRAVYDQQRIVVRDFDQGTPPQTGMIQVAEGQTANLGMDLLRAELRHSVVTFDAWADSTN